VLRFLGNDQFQWYSAYAASRSRTEDSLKKFARTAWQPGWIDTSDDKAIYQFKRPPHCIAYIAESIELGNNFLVGGFTLTKSNRVRAELVTWVGDRMRSLKKAKELLDLAAG
jgi:hypothetical protein